MLLYGRVFCSGGCFKIGGVGDVLTGRVEQGALKPGDLISFVPKRMTKEYDGKIKVFTIEQHQQADAETSEWPRCHAR